MMVGCHDVYFLRVWIGLHKGPNHLLPRNYGSFYPLYLQKHVFLQFLKPIAQLLLDHLQSLFLQELKVPCELRKLKNSRLLQMQSGLVVLLHALGGRIWRRRFFLRTWVAIFIIWVAWQWSWFGWWGRFWFTFTFTFTFAICNVKSAAFKNHSWRMKNTFCSSFFTFFTSVCWGCRETFTQIIVCLAFITLIFVSRHDVYPKNILS